MAAYFARHAWGNTTLQDLIDALAAASGRDLDAWRAGWLETAGTDRLDPRARRRTASCCVATPPDGGRRGRRCSPSAPTADGDGLERVALASVEVTGPRTPVEPARRRRPLPGQRRRPDLRQRPGPTPARGTRSSAAARAAHRALARRRGGDRVGHARHRRGRSRRGRCAALTGVLRAETADAVLEPYLTLAGDAVELWSPDGRARRARRRGGRRLPRRSPDARPPPGGAARRWPAPPTSDEVDLAAAQSRRRRRPAVARARCARPSSAARPPTTSRRLLERDPDPDAWVRAPRRARRHPDAEDKEAVWQALAVDRTVPISSVGQVATRVLAPGPGRAAGAVRRALPRAAAAPAPGGMIPAMVFTAGCSRCSGSTRRTSRGPRTAASAAPVVRKRLRALRRGTPDAGRAIAVRGDRAVRSRTWSRPVHPSGCLASGLGRCPRHTCARGELNPHALSGTRT